MLEEHSTTTTPASDREEQVESRRLPVVTLVLCAVNLLIWLVVLIVGGTGASGGVIWGAGSLPVLLALGAKVNALIQAGEYWRLITPMFLHLNLIHLAVNTYALLLLGGFIEQLYGPRRLLILYVMSGFCGNLFSYLMNPGASLGASTAVAGLFGSVLVFWWKYRQAIAPEYWQRMGTHLFGLLFINVMLGAVLPFLDSWGHLGGLLGGMLVAALAESRLSGEDGREREWLPVPLALATVAAMLVYAGLETVRGAESRSRPLRAAQQAMERRDWPRAASALQKAVVRHPELLGDYAGVLMQAGRGEEAERVYRRLLRGNPGNALIQNNLAYLYADTLNRNLEEALALARRATDAEPTNGVYRDTLGWIYYRLGRYDDAFVAMQDALRREPGEPDIRYHMGAVLEARGDLSAAAREYREALRLNPQLAPAARALQRLGRP
jgi:rhomboid protease GluP